MRNVTISGDFTIVENKNIENNAAPVTLPRKAQERIEALKKAGVDTANLFALGEGTLVRMSGGVPSLVADDDPVFNAIIGAGAVPDRRLFRRWVLAQTFRMLRMGYTQAIKYKGNDYTWEMLEEELRVQARLAGHDNVNFSMRNNFFNKYVVARMIVDYDDSLASYIDALTVRRCKGRPYKRVTGIGNVFLSDIRERVSKPINDAEREIRAAETPRSLYLAVSAFNKVRVRLNRAKQSSAWVDAYKGAGAYYSMQNLVRFHGLRLRAADDQGQTSWVSGEEAIVYLDACAHNKNGWELMGMLKQALDDNKIDVDEMIESWRK